MAQRGVRARISIPVDYFSSGAFIKEIPSGTVKFVPIIFGNVNENTLMLFSGCDYQSAFNALADSPSITGISELSHRGEKIYIECHIQTSDSSFLRCIEAADAIVVEAVGSGSQWEFEILFNNRNMIRKLQGCCGENGIRISFTLIDDLAKAATSYGGRELEYALTDQQKETLELAVKTGYFQVPRRTTITELADDLGISDQAVSERLRRGIQALLEGRSIEETKIETSD